MPTEVVFSTNHCEMHGIIKKRYTYEKNIHMKSVSSQSTNTTYSSPHKTSCYVRVRGE